MGQQETAMNAKNRSLRLADETRAAQHDARVEVDPSEDLVEDLAADIVEEHVDPVGAKLRKPREDYCP